MSVSASAVAAEKACHAASVLLRNNRSSAEQARDAELPGSGVVQASHLHRQLRHLRERCSGYEDAASLCSTLLLDQIADVATHRLTRRTNADSGLLTQRRHATEAGVLLFDGLLKQRGAELGKPRLQVATAKATRRTGTLQHGSLALLDLTLEERAALNLPNRLLLRVGTTKAQQRPLRFKRRRANLDIRGEQPANLVELAALFFDARLSGLRLRVCGLACSPRLHCATDE